MQGGKRAKGLGRALLNDLVRPAGRPRRSDPLSRPHATGPATTPPTPTPSSPAWSTASPPPTPPGSSASRRPTPTRPRSAGSRTTSCPASTTSTSSRARPRSSSSCSEPSGAFGTMTADSRPRPLPRQQRRRVAGRHPAQRYGPRVPALPLIVSVAHGRDSSPRRLLRALRGGPPRAENYRGVVLPFPAGGDRGRRGRWRPGRWPSSPSSASPTTSCARSCGPSRSTRSASPSWDWSTTPSAGASRGWRGHGARRCAADSARARSRPLGSLGLALYVLSGRGTRDGEYLLAVARPRPLSTNLFNLLDLRPGRSVKAFVLLGAGLTLGAWDVDPLWALGLFAGAVLVARRLRPARAGDAGRHRLEPDRRPGRPVARARAGHHGPGCRARGAAGDHVVRGVSLDLFGASSSGLRGSAS